MTCKSHEARHAFVLTVAMGANRDMVGCLAASERSAGS